MKIAVFIKSTTFHKGHGGLETQNRIMCEGLASRGHSVTVFSQRKEISRTEEFLNGVRYIFIPSSSRYFLAKYNKKSWHRCSFEVFRKLHLENPFAIVFSQSTGGIGIIDRKNELNIKVISVAHGTTLGEFKTYLSSVNFLSSKEIFSLARNLQYTIRQFFGWQRTYVLHSNKVIAVSSAVKKALIDETYVPEEKVRVIHNGIDPKDIFQGLRANSRDGNSVRLVFVGRIEKSKGLKELIEVFAEIKADNLCLDIIGEGPYIGFLSKLIFEKNLEDRVFLYGKLSHDEVLRVLGSREDIFVLPTKRVEGFPMTLVEAMFAGLPIVAMDLGGVSDAVVNRVTGYLIKPKDLEEMKNKIVGLVKDRMLREEMGRNAVKKASEEFTVDAMIKKYEEVIQEVLS